MVKESITTEYDELLSEIRSDPLIVIRERRLEKLAALKLLIPDIIRAHKINQRKHYESYEAAKYEVDKIKAELTLVIKLEVNENNKLAYRNKESREVEILKRLSTDPHAVRNEKIRRQMYAQAKGLSDEIDYYTRLDQSLIEILALFTSILYFESRFGESNDTDYTRIFPAKRTGKSNMVDRDQDQTTEFTLADSTT